MELSPGAVVGPYRLIEPAGHGGMAEVWRAYDARLDRDVAMKFISRHFANEPGYLERFRREARAISRLEHPNILTVHDFGEQDGFTYMVMPFIGSGTLAERLGQPWAAADALRVVDPLASALDYAHSRGVVHRDVKPSNVLFSAQDRLVLGDFGVARMLEGTSELSHVGLLIGTPRYMAPEQVEGHPATPASDLYALGIVAYELLTGRAPFVAETPLAVLRAHVDKPLPPPRSLNPALPEDVERVLFRALAKDPGDRFPDCGAFAARLRAAAGDVPTIVGDPMGDTPTLVTDVRPPSAGRSPADVRPPSTPVVAVAEPAPLHGGGSPETAGGSPAVERSSPTDPAVRAGRPGRPTRRGTVAAVLGGVTLIGLLALGSVALPQALPSATTRPPEVAPPSPTAGGNPAGVQAAAAAPAALPPPPAPAKPSNTLSPAASPAPAIRPAAPLAAAAPTRTVLLAENFDDPARVDPRLLTNSDPASVKREVVGERYSIKKINTRAENARAPLWFTTSDAILAVDAAILGEVDYRSISMSCRNQLSSRNSEYRAYYWPKTALASILRWDDGRSIVLHSRTVTNARGGNEYNHFEFSCSGRSIEFRINRELSAWAEDSTYSSGDMWFGVTTSSDRGVPIDAAFDNLVVALP